MPPGFFFRNQVASGPIRGRESVVIETPRAPGAWPAAGFVDTELRCLMELEVSNAETEVQPRVQA